VKSNPAIAAVHLSLGLALVAGALTGCAGKSQTKPRAVAPAVVRDTPSVLRGTVGSEASLQHAEPVLVSGYGLVVGLNGTGGGDLDERIAGTMERQLGLMQASKGSDLFGGTPMEGLSPRQILRLRDVAVVVVYSAVIPGAPKGATFDVYVRSASNSPEVSLEGGTLWTTELQVGRPGTVGGFQTRRLASAYGPIFVNPFADPSTRAEVTRRDGRILAGGIIVNPVDLQLVLDNESYSRSRQMTDAINRRFTPGAGDAVVARGRNARVIDVTVPDAYREHSNEFIQLLLHTQVDPSQPQEYARKYVEGLKTQPFLGDELSWCLQALPQKMALPFLRDMYDWPEQVPRLAAVRAGAGLGDPLTVPALKEMAKTGPMPVRADAIHLLGTLSAGPSVDTALVEQLHSHDLMVRVAAYEALVQRAEAIQRRRWMAQQASVPVATRVAWTDNSTDPRRTFELGGDTIQGIRRRAVAGRFVIDQVPAGDPLIYVSQQGLPKIVLFGDALEIKRPIMVSAWGGKGSEAPEASEAGGPHLPRLMLVAETPTDTPRLLYRYPDRLDDNGDVIPGKTVTSKVEPDLVSLIEYLAHSPSPDDPKPGLGLTYSEVVGALSVLQQKGAIDGQFAIEDDLLRARLLESTNPAAVEERPDTPEEAKQVRVYNPVLDHPDKAPQAQEKPSLVVPLEQPAAKKK
jgi:hypothetical protein